MKRFNKGIYEIYSLHLELAFSKINNLVVTDIYTTYVL